MFSSVLSLERCLEGGDDSPTAESTFPAEAFLCSNTAATIAENNEEGTKKQILEC